MPSLDERIGARIRGRRSVVVGLTLWGASTSSVAAQAGPLERWTVEQVAAGWMPAWRFDTPAETRLDVHVSAEVLRLGSWLRQGHDFVRVALRQPLGSSLAVRMHGASEAWNTETAGRTLLRTRRAEAVAAGVEARLGSPVGLVTLSGLAAWGEGFGGEARVSMEGPRHGVQASTWRSRGQGSVVQFPSDSLRDVAVDPIVFGLAGQAHAAVTLGAWTVRPSALLQLEVMDERSRSLESFFVTSPEGQSSTLELGIDTSIGSWELAGVYRSRDVDVESTLLRSGASAGRVFSADLEAERWAFGLGRAVASGRWSLTVTDERALGGLSTRVETWPFTSLWGTLAVQAYRLEGRLDTQARGASILWQPLGPGGWSWRADLSRYEARADRDSWFVTSFGFGRRDREQTTRGVTSAILLGGYLGRTLTTGMGAIKLAVEAGTPVQAEEVAGAPTSGSGSAGVSAYARASVRWGL